ncbi:ABC transporter permease [Diaminobutyricibacter tongyongensis]|uniref:Transport permease protein n=1 Tax=Leifsonia tongyongensis TaxID=1268043 RepID=A0A6L9XZT3_9MICO|nr:ABC transporter permease [Diaminobutyricibacter tongyongensis]NEN06939.1 ABC transporter permease [Diaminobutyricibacter tongyongensis]
MTETLTSVSDEDRARLAAGRPRRFGGWYVAEHRFRVMRSYLQTVLVTGIGNPFLYLFAIGVGLGSLVSNNLGPQAVDGVSYLEFVAPALLCTAAVTVASEEFTYPIMLGFKWNPTFYGMNAAPIAPGQIIDGVVISVTARLLATSVLYFVFMLLFGAVPSPIGFLAVFVAVLTGLAFGAPVMTYVSTLEQDTGQIAMLMRFVLLPMTLFSGTFFPLSAMPPFLRWIGWLSPLWHGTELARVFSYGAAEPIWLTVLHVLYLAALFVVGWLWTRRLAARRLNK